MQEEVTTLDINELMAQRRSKLEQMRMQGNAYPNHFRRDNIFSEKIVDEINELVRKHKAGMIPVKSNLED